MKTLIAVVRSRNAGQASKSRYRWPGPERPPESPVLIEQGIDSISLNPDVVLRTTLDVLHVEGAAK